MSHSREPDFLFRNISVVRSSGITVEDVAVKEGKIVSVTSSEANRVIDGRGLYLLPGLIDTHMHIRAPAFEYREDFTTGTAAAAAGGITTIFEMPVSNPPTYNVEVLKERVRAAQKNALVDFAFYGGAGYDNLDDIVPLARAGVIGFKTFTQRAVKGREKEFTGMTAPTSGALYKVFFEVAKTGRILAIHAETDSLIDLFTGEAGYGEYAACPHYGRPPVVELEAIARSIALAGVTHTRISLCHVSSPEGIELIRRMRGTDQEVHIESCLHYLEGSEDDVRRLGVYAKIKPPLRSAQGLPHMRRLFEEGRIDFLGSDHAPFSSEEKASPSMPDGIAAVEATLPILLWRVFTKEISLTRIAEICSERPAKAFGIFPRKGRIAVGADADLVVADLAKQPVVTLDKPKTRARDCMRLYEGRKAGGEVIMTMVRGRVVLEKGEIMAEPGYGRLVAPPDMDR